MRNFNTNSRYTKQVYEESKSNKSMNKIEIVKFEQYLEKASDETFCKAAAAISNESLVYNVKKDQNWNCKIITIKMQKSLR